MPLSVVRLGDHTSHGGRVVSASTNHTIRGIGIACVGDLVSCPLPGHGTNPIIEGSLLFTITGRKVALHGHRSACGCTLIASLCGASQG